MLRNFRWALFLSALIALLSSCSTLEEPPCSADGDCEKGYCIGGECKECFRDTHCPNEHICTDNFTCKKGCRRDSDCELGRICRSKKCVWGCKRDSDCPPPKACVSNVCTSVCKPGETRNCYPKNIKGCDIQKNSCQGTCQLGVQICQKNSQWGPCANFVPPAREVCDGKDNNCDGTIDEGCDCEPGQKRPCYTGPGGTEGKGICRKGVQFCLTSGKWSSCVGEVVPKAEVCDGKDNNCDGTIDECPQNKACIGGKCRCQRGVLKAVYSKMISPSNSPGTIWDAKLTKDSELYVGGLLTEKIDIPLSIGKKDSKTFTLDGVNYGGKFYYYLANLSLKNNSITWFSLFSLGKNFSQTLFKLNINKFFYIFIDRDGNPIVVFYTENSGELITPSCSKNQRVAISLPNPKRAGLIILKLARKNGCLTSTAYLEIDEPVSYLSFLNTLAVGKRGSELFFFVRTSVDPVVIYEGNNFSKQRKIPTGSGGKPSYFIANLEFSGQLKWMAAGAFNFEVKSNRFTTNLYPPAALNGDEVFLALNLEDLRAPLPNKLEMSLSFKGINSPQKKLSISFTPNRRAYWLLLRLKLDRTTSPPKFKFDYPFTVFSKYSEITKYSGGILNGFYMTENKFSKKLLLSFLISESNLEMFKFKSLSSIDKVVLHRYEKKGYMTFLLELSNKLEKHSTSKHREILLNPLPVRENGREYIYFHLFSDVSSFSLAKISAGDKKLLWKETLGRDYFSEVLSSSIQTIGNSGLPLLLFVTGRALSDITTLYIFSPYRDCGTDKGCSDLLFDKNNCGACGTTCNGECKFGRCVSP